jgi:1-acyl-sn-glycerol-3-phosphate acyltransferase
MTPTGARGQSETAEHGLGSDPFSGGDGTLPYLIRLRERALRLVPSADDEPAQARPSDRSLRREPIDLGPPVPEVGLDDADEGASWLDRAAGLAFDREDEQRLQRAVAEFGATTYDPLGLNARTARRAFAFFKLLYRHYFRVESTGHQVLPEKEGAILAANHGGLLPFDGAMTIVDVFSKASPPRVVRAIVERWAGTLPFVNVFYARVGQVIGTRENFRELLRRKQLVLVFPEGIEGIRKRAADRYVLRDFRLGFVEESLRNRVPIVPVAIVGADDQTPILYDVKPLAKLLGLPVFPITPTFPLLGPLGLLPYPVRYQIRYGEPFRFYEDYPTGAVHDPAAVRYMAEQVRRRVQEMVDRDVLARRSKKE